MVRFALLDMYLYLPHHIYSCNSQEICLTLCVSVWGGILLLVIFLDTQFVWFIPHLVFILFLPIFPFPSRDMLYFLLFLSLSVAQIYLFLSPIFILLFIFSPCNFYSLDLSSLFLWSTSEFGTFCFLMGWFIIQSCLGVSWGGFCLRLYSLVVRLPGAVCKASRDTALCISHIKERPLPWEIYNVSSITWRGEGKVGLTVLALEVPKDLRAICGEGRVLEGSSARMWYHRVNSPGVLFPTGERNSRV